MVAAAVITGCGKGSLAVRLPAAAPVVAERCTHLSNQLPQRLGSLQTRVTSPRSPLVHAWGSPAVVLACGVRPPVGYSRTSSATTVVNGIRWFEQPASDSVTWTALRPGGSAGPPVNVRLVVPTSYQGQGGFLVDLAPALKAALPGAAG